MTVKDFLRLFAGLDPSIEVVVRGGMQVMPIVAAQLTTDLQNTAERRVHLLCSPEMPTPYVDVNARLADAMDRLAPKKKPWEDDGPEDL